MRGQPVKVEITVADRVGLPVDTPPTAITMLAPAFAVAEEGMADGIDGWSGTLLERVTRSEKDVMTVYTNIDSTSGVPFEDEYDLVDGAWLLHDTHSTLMLGEADDQSDPIPTGMANYDIAAAAFTNANFISHDNNVITGTAAGTSPTWAPTTGRRACTSASPPTWQT